MDNEKYENNEQNSLEGLYKVAVSEMKNAVYEADYLRVATRFYGLRGYRDAEELEGRCRRRAEKIRNDDLLESAKYQMKSDTVYGYRKAIEALRGVKGRMETNELIAFCEKKIAELEAKEKKRRRRLRIWLTTACTVVLTAIVIGVGWWINPPPVLGLKAVGDGMIVVELK